METPKPESPDEIMCQCSGTTRGEIETLFCQEGLTLDGISRRTGTLTGCGGCEWDILEMLRHLPKPTTPTQD